MYCPSCGKEIKEGSKFCKYCGAKIVKEAGIDTKGKEVEQKDKKKKLLRKATKKSHAIGCLITIGVIIILALICNKCIEESPEEKVAREKSEQELVEQEKTALDLIELTLLAVGFKTECSVSGTILAIDLIEDSPKTIAEFQGSCIGAVGTLKEGGGLKDMETLFIGASGHVWSISIDECEKIMSANVTTQARGLMIINVLKKVK